MSRIAYVNGRYVPWGQASVHVEDRGFQFADGVYEVFPVYAGRIVNRDGHMQRLASSLQELRIDWPSPSGVVAAILGQVLHRNLIKAGGMIYLQITRGVAPRNHMFPGKMVRPTLVVLARSVDMAARDAQAKKGVRILSVADTRWARRDIKSVALLPNMMAKQQASEAGAAEALFVDQQGTVTEGASSTFWIVRPDDVLQTHPLGHEILPGVTRGVVLALAEELGYVVLERAFSLAEAMAAKEAFLTSATNFVMPVIQIDENMIGDGAPGRISTALRRAYIAKLEVF